LIPEETSVINNNHENSYSIVSVNGQCSSFKDDKIEITKILDEDYNDFSENNTIENNDHFVNLNSLLNLSNMYLYPVSNTAYDEDDIGLKNFSKLVVCVVELVTLTIFPL